MGNPIRDAMLASTVDDEVAGKVLGEAGAGIPPADPVLQLTIRSAMAAVEAAGVALDAAQQALLTAMAYAERVPAPDVAAIRAGAVGGQSQLGQKKLCVHCGSDDLHEVPTFDDGDLVLCGDCGKQGSMAEMTMPRFINGG